MLDIEDARQQMLAQLSAVSASETIDLNEALGRVLAEDVVSPIDVPPADNSAMDGYAINTAYLAAGENTFEVSQRIAAGQAPQALTANTAARIFTGGEIPPNADAVVMQENCEASGNAVTILKTPKPAENIRPQGQDIAKGSRILQAGHKLRPQEIGLLASVGLARTKVRRQLKVALLSTGDELVEPGKPLAPGQIYNSNLPMLSSAVQALGCEVSVQQIVADNLEATQAALGEAANQSDLVMSSGGVSVGEEDHVKAAVESLGALKLWKIRIKPGKPLAFGHIGEVPFMGLPGNPVSSFVTFCLFGVPAIKTLAGQQVAPLKSFLLPTNFDLPKVQSRPEFIRVRIENGTVERFPNQSSGVLSSLCWADALALVPAQTPVRRGDLVEVFLLEAMLG